MSVSEPSAKWETRPWLARLVRIGVVVAPLITSLATVTVAGRLVPRPDAVVSVVVWWVGLTLLATVVLWLMDRLLRRVLPVVALFKLSLVFPDRAPSRFKTAIRTGTVRQLERNLSSGEYGGSTPQEAAEQLVALAAALNAHDRMTRGHTERVRAYSAMIGEEMDLSAEDLELLNWSGLVHDIGKLTVPTEILNKPGRPSEDEWAILRDHPMHADELIEPLRPWLGSWAESATQHHERFDGGGYPNGLVGDEITLAGRIVAVADAYDVMTSTRSYKKPMSAEDARFELSSNSGSQFDPEVVRAFLNLAIGRLRLVMGPLSSLVQFPAGSASLGSSAVTGAGAVASVAVSAALGLLGPAGQPVEPIPEVIAFAATETHDVELSGSEDEEITVAISEHVVGPAVSLELVGEAEHGEATLVDGIVLFVPDPDFNGTVEIGYRACFEDGSCDEAVITVEVGAQNDRPVAAPDVITIDEDSVANVDVVANDTDIDGDELVVVDAVVVDHPNYSLSEAGISFQEGRVLVEPAADVSGLLLIEYVVADPTGTTATSTLVVTVEPVEDAPQAYPDAFTGYENTEAVIDVLSNDVDVDGDALTIVSIADASGGAATTDGSTVTFIPSPRHVGPASFSYTITDGDSTSTAAVNLTITDITSTPLVNADTITIDEDQAAVLDVLANDLALTAELNPTTVTTITAPTQGSAIWNGAEFDYQPLADWSGEEQFDYLVCDVLEFCNIATVSITVTPVNDVPSFVKGPDQTVAEDAAPQTINGWATAISPGPVDEAVQNITFSVVATNGHLFSALPTIDPSGRLAYTPAPDANGTSTLTIIATDDGGTTNGGTDTTAAATATITITPVNDDPVAVDDGATVAEDDLAGVTFDVLTNDSDVDGDTVQYGSADTSTVVNGTITDHLDGSFTYVPDEHYSGAEVFTFTVIDGNGGNDTSTVTITVTALADPPVASDDARATAVDAPLSVTAPGVLINDYDVDGETLTVATTPITPPANGSVTLYADGSYLYTPDPGYVGTDSFTYQISDPGGLTSTATVTITIDSGVVNQAYYLGDSGSAAWNYNLLTTPPPSSAPVFDSDSNGDPGLTILNSGGGEGESDTTKYQLWSLTAGVALQLDGPVTLDLWSTVENYDLSKAGHPFAYLYDCLGVSCTLLSQADVHTDNWNQGIANFSNRQVDLGSVTHTIVPGRDLVVRLQFKHEDMWIAATTDYPSALNLTLANQTPVAAADTATIDEDDPTTNLVVLANDTDADIDPASVTVTVAPTSGTATPVGDGTIDYTPNPDVNGVDSFTYQVCDLGGNCDTATMAITINPVNDEPSFTGGGAVAAGLGANNIGSWATGISAGPADETGQTLTFVITANDNPGLFSAGPAINPITGDLSFTAVGTGIANITVQASDDGGTANGGDDASITYNFTITIT